jgi:hypothetical protein
MKIPKKIEKEINEYCEINNIEDVDKFLIEKLTTGFNIEKYGNAPFIQEVVIEKEVPVEIIKEIIVEKEVPIEIIKEVIKEIPIEKEIIKEIVVEKEVLVTDDEKMLSMGVENNKLKSDILIKEQEILDLNTKISGIDKKNSIGTKKIKDINDSNKKLEKSIKERDIKIKELKDSIVDLEKENTKIKNESPTTKGRPIRDIYDDDPNLGGFWGSNLKDKK